MMRLSTGLKLRHALLCGGAFFLAQGVPSVADPSQDTMTFPQFDLAPLFSGEAMSIVQDGQPVYIDLWASWCAPCLRTLPEVKALSEAYADDDIGFILINVDESPEIAQAFAHRLGVEANQYSDPTGSIMKELAVEGLPTGFLLDADGRIRLVHVGGDPAAAEFLKARIDQLLAEQRFKSAMRTNGETR